MSQAKMVSELLDDYGHVIVLGASYAPGIGPGIPTRTGQHGQLMCPKETRHQVLGMGRAGDSGMTRSRRISGRIVSCKKGRFGASERTACTKSSAGAGRIVVNVNVFRTTDDKFRKHDVSTGSVPDACRITNPIKLREGDGFRPAVIVNEVGDGRNRGGLGWRDCDPTPVRRFYLLRTSIRSVIRTGENKEIMTGDMTIRHSCQLINTIDDEATVGEIRERC